MAKKVNALDSIMPVLINILEKEIIKQALIRIVGSTVGFKAWLVKFVIEEVVIDEVLVPAIEYGERKLTLIYDKAQGRYVYKKLEKAADNIDIDEWRDAASRM